jgi:outer membrane protein
MRHLATIILAGLLFARAGSEEIFLTPRGAVELALRHNSSIAVQRYEPILREADVTVERGAFDPTFTAGLGGQSLGPATGTNYTVGIRHKLGFGATYGIEHSSGTDILGQSSSRTSMTLRVPLLKGAGSEVTQAGVNNALGNLEVSRFQLEVATLDLAGEVETAYWSLVLAHQVTAVRRRAVDQAESFLGMLDQEIAAGASAPYERYEAEQNLASRQADVRAAEGEVEFASNQLSRLIGSPASAISVTQEAPTTDLLDLEFYQRQALSNRPLLKAAQKEIELQELRRRVAQNGSLPQLDLVASHSLAESGVNPYRWQAGLQLALPIGNREGQGRVERATAAREQAEARVEDLRQRVLLETAQAHAAASASLRQLEAGARASEKAKERVDAESERFSAGFTAAHRVVLAQQQQLGTDEELLAARIKLQLALVGLRRATGTILESQAEGAGQ